MLKLPHICTLEEHKYIASTIVNKLIKYLQNRQLCHLIFWIIVISTITVGLLDQNLNKSEIAIEVIECFLYVVITYYMVLFAIPKFLYRKKIALFIISTIIAVIIISYVNYLVYLNSNTEASKFFAKLNFLVCAPLSIFFAFFSTALKLMRDLALQVYEMGIQKEEQLKQELGFLRHQLSPHFLLNTMNNIYGLSVQQSPQLPNLILRLSDLLRYSIYDGKTNTISLKEELKYLMDYIELQRIRLNADIDLVIDLPEHLTKNYTITPMILVVFLENAFKHGLIANASEEKFIHLKINFDNDYLYFELANSFKTKLDKEQFELKSEGIGLINTMRRIEILYGKESLPEIVQEGGIYKVKLKLKLEDE